jgi:hypothetical protein
MKSGWRGVAAIACAVGAAVFWAVDLALWQPLAERPGEVGENNTYWARDLRSPSSSPDGAIGCPGGQPRRSAPAGSLPT